MVEPTEKQYWSRWSVGMSQCVHLSVSLPKKLLWEQRFLHRTLKGYPMNEPGSTGRTQDGIFCETPASISVLSVRTSGITRIIFRRVFSACTVLLARQLLSIDSFAPFLPPSSPAQLSAGQWENRQTLKPQYGTTASECSSAARVLY